MCVPKTQVSTYERSVLALGLICGVVLVGLIIMPFPVIVCGTFIVRLRVPFILLGHSTMRRAMRRHVLQTTLYRLGLASGHREVLSARQGRYARVVHMCLRFRFHR